MTNEAILTELVLNALLALCAVSLAIMPYCTRRTIAFGVAIPADCADTPPLPSLRRRYLVWNLIFGAAAMGGNLLWGGSKNPMIFITALLLLLAASFVLYWIFYRRCLALKREQGWEERRTATMAVELSTRPDGQPSAWWLLLFPVIIGITALLSWILYPLAPEQLPIHAGFSGQVDAWAPKSPGALLLLPLTQLFLSLIFAFCFYVIRSSRRQLDPQQPNESRRRLAMFRRSWSLFLLWGGCLLLCCLSLSQLAILSAIPFFFAFFTSLFCALGLILAAVWLGLKIGQGGSRLPNASDGNTISLRDDDRYWKLGCFYFNPDDPAVFVEKRFGVGWTSNFARPMTYVWLLLLVLLIAALAYASTFLV